MLGYDRLCGATSIRRVLLQVVLQRPLGPLATICTLSSAAGSLRLCIFQVVLYHDAYAHETFAQKKKRKNQWYEEIMPFSLSTFIYLLVSEIARPH